MRAILTLSLALLLQTQLHAQELDKFINSKQFKEFDKEHKRQVRHELRDKETTSQTTDYEKIFSKGKNGAKFLLKWLGTSAKYRSSTTNYQSEKSHVGASRLFLFLGNEQKIKLSVLVPRPSSIEAHKLGLHKEFRELEPPDLKVEHKESLKFGEIPGTLYYHRKGSCSLLLKFSKGAIVNAFTETCANREHLIGLMQSLDTERLEKKLNS